MTGWIRFGCALLLASCLGGSLARAATSEDLYSGTGSPWTIGDQAWSVGVFRPLTVGLDERTEVSTTGLVSLVSPRLVAKRRVWSSTRWALAMQAGLGVPTAGLRLLQGSVVSSDPDQQVPWALVAGAGPVLGWRHDRMVVSLGVYGRVGVPLGEGELDPTDMAWLDPMLAPLVEGWSLTPRIGVDWLPSERWVLSLDSRLQWGGGPDWNTRLFALRQLGIHTALGAGLGLARETFTTGPRDEWIWLQDVVPLVDFQVRY
ncbi:MAG: hypothetical protein QGG40_02495 [Myxococcota bacterium]|jgi:hypothetical protein|nr:hypothetical protein [Myxococcota bacterium]